MLLEQKRCKELLVEHHLDIPEQYVFKNFSELEGHGHVLEHMNFPVALKVDSEKIIHKSDEGYVITDIKNKEELKKKYEQLEQKLREKNIQDHHFLLQEMVKGTEFIVGMKRDEIFGPVILFGLGGVFVEVLEDVTMRIAPLSHKDCRDMINGIKSKKLIEGYRNYPRVPEPLLISVLTNISEMAMEEENIQEIDFNPVIVNEKEAKVVDARIILK